jgi:hypothetical protein
MKVFLVQGSNLVRGGLAFQGCEVHHRRGELEAENLGRALDAAVSEFGNPLFDSDLVHRPD